MARSILEGIVMGMDENLSLFRKKLGNISRICISGGLTKFAAYNQLQADIFGHGVTLYPNRESASLGAWISASVTLGLYGSYDEAFRVVQPAGSETVFNPEPEKTRLYRNVNEKRTRLYHVVHEVEKGEDN
jgi:sugar (pentulose or hexulose) kinase